MADARASVEVTAKTVEEAIERGLAQLGASRDEVEIEVLHPGRSGVFGLGAQDASVRLTRIIPPQVRGQIDAEQVAERLPVEEAAKLPSHPEWPPETVGLAVGLLQGLIDRMGIRGKVLARVSDEFSDEEGAHTLVLNVTGKDLGILIGRQAETLQALQYIVRLMLSKRLARWEPVVVDVESYRLRRRRALQRLALRMAERAVSTRRRVVLEAMPANERRIVHLALREHPGVITKSVGEGDRRKVTIIPK
ncbi:MAG: Jag N-terminal domain-containing protein [Anaerolineae bacterium]|nr:Jag N-terminal domain-containing protein [Anaerolineae bacterium]MDW8071008.1 RNA-binding cell elongation regulator Jag/EloR [Anaerolineae bacterium]